MKITIDKGLRIPMADGTVLAADLYLPAGDATFPTILQRLPYGKDVPGIVNIAVDPVRAAERGFAVVVQDTRGRNASEGEFEPYVHEAGDGVDTIAWIRAQSWSSGRVGMFGPSYVGAVQWEAAVEGGKNGPDAIAPFVTSTDFYDGWTYQAGALRLGFIHFWAIGQLGLTDVIRDVVRGVKPPEALGACIGLVDQLRDHVGRTPLMAEAELLDFAPYYREWLSHRSYDEYWSGTSVTERLGELTVPTLNIGGWFDLFVRGTLAGYRAMKEQAVAGLAPQPRLVVGPWSHGNMSGEYPDISFGSLGDVVFTDLTTMHLDWFDIWLRDGEPPPETSPVKIFVMGANAWRDEADWPLPDTAWTPYFLNADAGGAGTFGPDRGEPGERGYAYDPRDPVPTRGGTNMMPGFLHSQLDGPHDQRVIEARADVLTYTTPVLTESLEVTGPLVATLKVVSSALDTDFTVKLVDVHPDGAAIGLADGIVRARYREGLQVERLLEPGTPYELSVDLGATSNVFLAGHRIRVEVSSSNFPQYDRNTNTGGAIFDEDVADSVVAENRVLHGGDGASHLVLPIIRRVDA